jgi:phosphohistidine phosphatase
MPTLALLRHAKSAYPAGVADHDRPLNPRGRRDAPVAGRLLAQFLPTVDRALISTATRAQQTWDLAAPGVDVAQAKNVPELYLASADAMLRRIRAVDADSLLIVAHNPGIEVLAERLSRDTRTPTYRRMMTKFPTAAFAVLSDDRPFSDWGYGTSDLVTFEVARG